MRLNPFCLHRPQTVSEALRIKAECPSARFLAGGTFLINQLTLQKRKGLTSAPPLISLRHIPELQGLTVSKEGMTIGSMTLLSDIVQASLAEDRYGFLPAVAKGIGTNQIRNMGTLGGNLCSRYCWAELSALALACEAKLYFLPAGGSEKTLTAADFFLAGAKERGLLTRITLGHPTYALTYYRFSRTPHLDLPLLAIAARGEVEQGRLKHVRIVLNTGVAFVQRAVELEAQLNGQSLTAAFINKVSHNFDPCVYDAKASEYKQQIYRVGLREALGQLNRKLGLS